MASIRKRNNRWEVRVRRSGYPTQTKTFTYKSSAQTWAREAELALEQGKLTCPLSNDSALCSKIAPMLD